MVLITQSLMQFLKKKGLGTTLVQLGFGHSEALTPELEAEYIEWVQTEEGKSYLKGGENYNEEYGSKIEAAMKGEPIE